MECLFFAGFHLPFCLVFGVAFFDLRLVTFGGKVMVSEKKSSTVSDLLLERQVPDTGPRPDEEVVLEATTERELSSPLLL